MKNGAPPDDAGVRCNGRKMMRILIGYDGSDSADAALDDLRLAGLPRDAEALVVTVADVLMAPPQSRYEVATHVLTGKRSVDVPTIMSLRAIQALEEAEEQAVKAAERVQAYFPGWVVSAGGVPGAPSWTLIEKAEAWGADLVAVGSRGRSALGRLLLGSVSRAVAAESRTSVRIARRRAETGGGAPPRIVVGVDGSSEAERAVRAVGERVWPGGTEVRVVAVDDGTSPGRIAHLLPTAAAMIAGRNEEAAVRARSMVEWAESELRAVGLDASVALLGGDPRRVLVEESRKWGADSIFVGPRKFSGAVERLRLGSVSTAVATNAHCSVEVVR